MKDFKGWHVVAIVLIVCLTILMALGHNSWLNYAMVGIVGSVFGIDLARAGLGRFGGGDGGG